MRARSQPSRQQRSSIKGRSHGERPAFLGSPPRCGMSKPLGVWGEEASTKQLGGAVSRVLSSTTAMPINLRLYQKKRHFMTGAIGRPASSQLTARQGEQSTFRGGRPLSLSSRHPLARPAGAVRRLEYPQALAKMVRKRRLIGELIALAIQIFWKGADQRPPTPTPPCAWPCPISCLIGLPAIWLRRRVCPGRIAGPR